MNSWQTTDTYWGRHTKRSKEGRQTLPALSKQMMLLSTEMSVLTPCWSNFHYYPKHMRWPTYKKKSIVLAHSFQGFSSPCICPVTLGLQWCSTLWQSVSEKSSHFMIRRKRKRGVSRIHYPFQRRDLWPGHTLKGSITFQQPQARDQAFNTWALGGHLRSKLELHPVGCDTTPWTASLNVCVLCLSLWCKLHKIRNLLSKSYSLKYSHNYT